MPFTCITALRLCSTWQKQSNALYWEEHSFLCARAWVQLLVPEVSTIVPCFVSQPLYSDVSSLLNVRMMVANFTDLCQSGFMGLHCINNFQSAL